MRIRCARDFWAGLIFIAFGVAFIALAQQYRLGDLHRIGPGMFPTLVGALLAGLGLIITTRAFVLEGTPIERIEARPLGVSLLAIVLFGLALQWLRPVAAPSGLVLLRAQSGPRVRLGAKPGLAARP